MCVCGGGGEKGAGKEGWQQEWRPAASVVMEKARG